ncbi:MAG: hypothetical protein DRN00_01935 [Thermoplasmata archaeon]|nr:MAG: hypothetical protein DRN03_04030 [Thermoplasmata archaeon]RLF39425.1 MAG: hypothetical protein DRN00_01935 [Thermoplasmata archaeon]
MPGIWRELRLPVTILMLIVGLILLLTGIIWIWFPRISAGLLSELANSLANWNYYGLVVGIILLISGIWYLYDFIKKRKTLLEKMKTDRRSEFVKRRKELEKIAKSLPRKYEKMLLEKMEELKIK